MAYLNIQIDDKTKARLREQAAKDKRTLGSEAFYLIETGLSKMQESFNNSDQPEAKQ